MVKKCVRVQWCYMGTSDSELIHCYGAALPESLIL